MLSKRVSDIIDRMTQIDFIAAGGNESSLLRANEREIVINLIREKVLPKYVSTLTKLGGVDNVLKDLEDFIVRMINAISPQVQSGISPGELARSDLKYRKEIKGELGKYHTALRALKDSKNTISWPSLLHTGSQARANGFELRELLALYWLAASDPDMEFSETFAPEVKDETTRKQFLQASLEVFIDVLCEIRRAHNEGASRLSNVDIPSCAPGTFGRIVSRCSVYNKITALPPNSFRAIPDAIHAYMVEILQQCSLDIRAAVGNYINQKLMGDEPTVKDVENYNKFINAFDNADQLKKFLLAQKHLKLNEFLYGKIKNLILEILQIERENIKLNPDSRPNSTLIYRLFYIGIKSQIGSKILEEMSPELIEFRLNLRQLFHEIQVLDRLVNNELIRGMLSHKYLTSDKFTYKSLIFFELAEEYFGQIDKLYHQLNNQLVVEGEKKAVLIKEKVLNETDFPKDQFNFNSNNESSTLLQQTFQLRFQQLVTIRSEMLQKLNLMVGGSLTLNNLQKIAAILPKPPLQQAAEYYKGGTEQWALNIIRIANEKETNDALLNDQREMERNLQLIDESFDQKGKELIISKIKDFAFLPTLTSTDLSDIIRGYINRLSQLTLESLIGVSKTILSDDVFEGIYNQSKIQIFRGQGFKMQDYNTWKSIALHLLGNDLSEDGVGRLVTFILLTFFNNLQITKMRQEDAKTLEWLCKCYLGIVNYDALCYKIYSNDSLENRINKIAGHLSCLLTTLKNLSTLVDAGCICLMPKDEAIALIRSKSNLLHPYLIRISNSCPDSLIFTVGFAAGQVSEYKMPLDNFSDDRNNNDYGFSCTIEGKLFTFGDASKGILRCMETYFLLQTLIVGNSPIKKLLTTDSQEKLRSSYVKRESLLSVKESTRKLERSTYVGKSELTPPEASSPSIENKNKLLFILQIQAVKAQPKVMEADVIIKILSMEDIFKFTSNKDKMASFFQNTEMLEEAFAFLRKLDQHTFTFFSSNLGIWQKNCILHLQKAYMVIMSRFLNLNTLTYEDIKNLYDLFNEASASPSDKLINYCCDNDNNNTTLRDTVLKMLLDKKNSMTVMAMDCSK